MVTSVLSQAFAEVERISGSMHFIKIRSALWTEFCIPCGKKVLAAVGGGRSRDLTVEPEAECFWNALAAEEQRLICRHIERHQAERRRETEARKELAEVARRCCDVALEPILFRPFAVLAGLPPDVATDYLTMTRNECLHASLALQLKAASWRKRS